MTAARWTFDKLLPYSRFLATADNVLVLGPVDYYRGRLPRALGDAASGERYLQQAKADSLREGLRWWAQQSEAHRAGAVGPPQVVR